MDSRTRLLLGILTFAGLCAVWTWIGPAADEETSPPLRTPGTGRSAAPLEHIEEPLFAALAVRPVERVPGRDPWRFVELPRPAQRGVQSPVRHPGSEPAQPVPMPAPVMTAPEPPAFPWTYLGSFGPAHRRIAVFAESAAPGAPVQNRREGEILAERFVLERIGIESVDVRPLNLPGAPAQRLVPGSGKGRRVS